MQWDPIAYEGEDFNLYRYCTNDPLMHTDPSGLAGSDIKFIDHIVKKYGLSYEGREALHRALNALREQEAGLRRLLWRWKRGRLPLLAASSSGQAAQH